MRSWKRMRAAEKNLSSPATDHRPPGCREGPNKRPTSMVSHMAHMILNLSVGSWQRVVKKVKDLHMQLSLDHFPVLWRQRERERERQKRERERESRRTVHRELVLAHVSNFHCSEWVTLLALQSIIKEFSTGRARWDPLGSTELVSSIRHSLELPRSRWKWTCQTAFGPQSYMANGCTWQNHASQKWSWLRSTMPTLLL